MQTTRSHLEMLTGIKRPRLSLRCERKRTCQNQNTGVEGMRVRWNGEMRREGFPFDIDNIPLAFPLGFDCCGIHASLLCLNSLHCTVAFLYTTPSVLALQNLFSHIHHPLGVGVGFGVVIEHA